jgi:hypothetical protein
VPALSAGSARSLAVELGAIEEIDVAQDRSDPQPVMRIEVPGQRLAQRTDVRRIRRTASSAAEKAGVAILPLRISGTDNDRPQAPGRTPAASGSHDPDRAGGPFLGPMSAGRRGLEATRLKQAPGRPVTIIAVVSLR